VRAGTDRVVRGISVAVVGNFLGNLGVVLYFVGLILVGSCKMRDSPL
jgi:hypothetical protein